MEGQKLVEVMGWLALAPINRAFDVFVLEEHTLATLTLVAVLGVLTFSRTLLHPPLPKRFPRLVWAADMVLLPTLVLLGGALIERGLFRSGAIDASLYVDIATTLAFYLVMAWLIGRGIELFFWKGLVERRTGYAVPILLRGLSYVTLILIVVLIILARSGYSPTGLLISTGVAAAILGLALQNTLGDLFSGIALSVEQAYGIGDWIELDDGTLGEVVDITWRTTRLISFNDSTLILPNASIAARRIHNLARPTPVYAQWYEVKLPAEIEPTTAKRLLTDAVMRVRHILHEPAPVIRLVDAGTIPYTYTVYVRFRSFMDSYPGRDAMFRQIDAELRRMGTRPSTATQEVIFSRRGDFHLQPSTVAHALRAVDLFAVLDTNQLDSLAKEATFEAYEADSRVVTQGQHVDTIYVVWSGLLRSHFYSTDGVKIEVEELRPGDSFGQIPVITNEPGLVTIEAATESILICLRMEALAPLLEVEPALSQLFAKVVAERMQSLDRAQAAHAATEISALPTSVAEIKRRLEDGLFGRRGRNARRPL